MAFMLRVGVWQKYRELFKKNVQFSSNYWTAEVWPKYPRN